MSIDPGGVSFLRSECRNFLPQEGDSWAWHSNIAATLNLTDVWVVRVSGRRLAGSN
jgi:hypothetical protein